MGPAMVPPPAVVMIVDADPATRRRLGRLLRQAHYRVLAVPSLEAARRRSYDAAIVTLVDRAALAALAAVASRAPAVISLAPPAVIDVVAALDAGADDYLAQPADPDELLARLRAQLRRRRTESFAIVVTDDFTVDFTERRLVRLDTSEGHTQGREVHLTPTEWRLLEQFTNHPDRLLTHEQILRQVWGPAKNDKVVYLRVYVAALRRKLEPDPASPRYFVTEPGFGFRFRPGRPPASALPAGERGTVSPQRSRHRQCHIWHETMPRTPDAHSSPAPAPDSARWRGVRRRACPGRWPERG
ncbi:MAG TPA: winged helix-turn-helix domain-containing protein [Acidimicrobiales bacterium]|jgi:two-component system KDP operon response regulator KdpE|nr:winged helix-turn-helix domain-containing protein [Acidimicrobiales bacterium]